MLLATEQAAPGKEQFARNQVLQGNYEVLPLFGNRESAVNYARELTATNNLDMVNHTVGFLNAMVKVDTDNGSIVDADTSFAMAEAVGRKRNYPAATEWYKYLEEHYPKHSEVQFLIGAEEDDQRATNLYQQAQKLSEEGKYAEAMTTFDKTMILFDGDVALAPTVVFRRGETLIRAGAIAEGIKDLEAAQPHLPDNKALESLLTSARQQLPPSQG